jgi:hypothetical protein
VGMHWSQRSTAPEVRHISSNWTWSTRTTEMPPLPRLKNKSARYTC